jgi:subtilisin family serine protease
MALVLTALVTVAEPASAAVNDAKYEAQWGFQKVGAEYAWGRSTGKGVLIAVVDTGVDASHPDLAGQVLPGYDFVTGDGDARDETGHGTLVAGIAAAASNNGTGIASVAPGAQILPVRVLAGDGTGNAGHAAAGIRWAVDTARARGQRLVVNLSLDWTPTAMNTSLIADLIPAGFVQEPQIDAAVKYAAGAGAVVVLAAGNEGKGETAYDATTPGILVVGSSDRSDQRASFSNYGQGLDLVAPGVEILSTYWSGGTGSTYALAKGTSVSVPFVSATAALLLAAGASNVEAANTILNTARDLGSPGWDYQTGRGLLDTAAALGVTRTAVAAPPAAPAPQPAPAPKAAAPAPAPVPPPPAPEPAPPPPAPEPEPAPSPAPPEPSPLAAVLVSQNGPWTRGDRVVDHAFLAAALLMVVVAMHAARLASRALRRY